MLKKSIKVSEVDVQPSKAPPKRSGNESDPQASKKKKVEEIWIVTSKNQHVSPSMLHILEDVLKHQCVGHRQAEELLVKRMNLEIEMTKALNDWNNEFVKVKYLQGEYKKKYDSKIKEMKVAEEQLAQCRAELATMAIFASLQNQQMDHLHINLHQIQEARDHIYDVKVKALELECMEEGFVRGFLKGVRLVHRKTRAEVEGLTPSQASGDSTSDSDGNEIESKLQKSFDLEDDTDIEIL
ncbi:hypothetical protein M5K25_000633 [Dendrobium thyrsiflorum]|uniref:Uncharacterized protein n=1 Tax=Dendrobium thyrsiflorum TaxID=117978 RepID=A0ABD0VW08_DENTH